MPLRCYNDLHDHEDLTASLSGLSKNLVTILARCTRLHYDLTTLYQPLLRLHHARSCHDQFFYIYRRVFPTTINCVEVIMADRLDLILHDLLLLQEQQAELDSETAVLLVRRRRRRQRRPKAFWVRPWLQAERRLLYGHYNRLMAELIREDQQSLYRSARS